MRRQYSRQRIYDQVVPPKKKYKWADKHVIIREMQIGLIPIRLGFPGGLEGKASARNAGDPGSVPESGRPLGEGNDSPLQYSCLENPMDCSLPGYSPWGRKVSDTTERLHFHFMQ